MPLKSIRLLLIVLSAIYCIACANQPECNQEVPYNQIAIGFYDIDDFEKEFVKYEFILATGGSEVLFNRRDSILNEKRDSLQVLDYVVNPASGVVVYNFITGVRRDSIELGYTRQLLWLSEECGPNYEYDKLTVISHSFDSVRLVQPLFDNTIDENIRIYN